MEKMMDEHKDKLQESDLAPLKTAVEKVKEASKGEDVAAITTSVKELEAASHALSKVMYESAGADNGESPAPDGPVDNGSVDSSEDDAVDAEFEVKND